MAQMTMTEALAELKTLRNRLTKRRADLMPYLWRQEGLKDPIKDGGSEEYVARERQGIRDMERRYVFIRTAIQRLNQVVDITILDETRTMAEWLNWRKEIANEQLKFQAAMLTNIRETRKTWQARGAAVVKAGEATQHATDILINVDEQALIAEGDKLTDILGRLDGQLSLKLAVTTIDVV